MRWRDILGLSLSALWQQKARTLFTLLGVLFGAFVLAASLAIGQGVQDAIGNYVRQNEAIRRVEVWPNWVDAPASSTQPTTVPGAMSDARRTRLQKEMAKFEASTRPRRERVMLTPDVLKKLETIPHVQSSVPMPWLRGFAVLGEDRSQPARIGAARPADAAAVKRLVAGRFFQSAGEQCAVVNELLLYRLGAHDDAEVNATLGKKLRLEFRPDFRAGIGVWVARPDGGQQTREEALALDSLRRKLPESLDRLGLDPMELQALRKAVAGSTRENKTDVVAREFTIVGVLRAANEQEEQAPWDPFKLDADVVLPYAAATDLFFEQPGAKDDGVNHVVLMADRDENVKGVVEAVRATGLQGHAALEFIEKQRLMFLLIFGGMTCVAAVAMIVAALGITNTMLISVLERTREIGIMKAIGARSGHLQAIFLVEGALIGVVGGALGLLLAWAASFPGDAWVRQISAGKLEQKIDDSIFVFPAWLQVAVIASCTLVTLLAAVYPARRAARLDPVTALRHE